MDPSTISSLSRGQLQGAAAQIILGMVPRPLDMTQLQIRADRLGVWLPKTPEQAAGLLYRGETPIQTQLERW